MNFKQYSVGDVVCAPDDEKIQLDLTNGGLILILKFNKPTSKEKNDIKRAVPQFKLAVVDDVVFFLSRFGTGTWMDSPFHRDLCPATIIEKIEPGTGIALYIMLIDAKTGALEAQRLVGLSTDFSKKFVETIMAQPPLINLKAYFDNLPIIYKRYTTTDFVDMAIASN